MKLNKRISTILVGILVVGTMMTTGCKANDNKIETPESTKIEIDNEKIKQDFDKYNVLTYEVVKTEKSGGITIMTIRVTNNGDKAVNNHFMTFGVYDDEGTSVEEECYGDEKVLQPGKSANQELYIDSEDAIELHAITCNYDIPEDDITVYLNLELKEITTDKIFK